MVVVSQRDAIITSERLYLAPASRNDYTDWARLRGESREHLRPWEPIWPHDAHSRSDWARRLKVWNASWKEGRAFVFLIRRIDNNALVGGVSLTNVRAWPAESASVGYWLGAAQVGHGYMREAVAALCDWSFSQLGLKRLEAGTLAENTRSRAVLEAVGFKEEGYASAYLEIAGQRRDHVLFGLVRTERGG